MTFILKDTKCTVILTTFNRKQLMTKKDIEQLFNILCEEAKNINAWEALELIQQAQVAFDCAYDSFND